MTDRPIIFSAPMVRALLEGRKTQTRRLATSPLSKCQAGDRLYVRENFWFKAEGTPDDLGYRETVYQALDFEWDGGAAYQRERGFRLRPCIHMPRWASRLTLNITAVRVEPISALSSDDALAEGISFDKIGFTAGPLPEGQSWSATPEIAYRVLWRSLHGQDSLDADPEVVALSFTVEQRNIDRIAA